MFSLKAMTVALVACAAQIVLMLSTYTLCVHQKHCPAWLPTISNTFVFPPGSYLSRFVMGNVAIVLGVNQFVIYAIGKDGGRKPKLNRIMFVMGFVASVLLAVVGAVCDSKTPTCRGNDDVHSTAAVLFFVGYNAMMVCASTTAPHASGSGRMLLPALAFLSTACKLRFIAPVGAVLAGSTGPIAEQPWVPIVEWTDVFVMMCWVVLYLANHGAGFRVGFVMRSSSSDQQGDGDANVRAFFSARFLATLCTAMYLGTLGVSLVFMFVEHRIGGTVPMISDMWVYQPGDWFGRFGCVAGATTGIVAHWALYYLDTDLGATYAALASVSLLGLAGVGCVDESENITVHTTFAVTYFGSYCAFMLLTTASRLRRSLAVRTPAPFADRLRLGAMLVFALVGTLGFVVRFFPAPATAVESALASPSKSVAAVAEWTTALAIIGYFNVLIGSLGAKSQGLGLGVVSSSSSSPSSSSSSTVGGRGDDGTKTNMVMLSTRLI